MKLDVITVHLKFAKNMARFLISFVALFAYANGFCMNMPGGIGEYHMECTTTSIGKYRNKYSNSPHYAFSKIRTCISGKGGGKGSALELIPTLETNK